MLPQVFQFTEEPFREVIDVCDHQLLAIRKRVDLPGRDNDHGALSRGRVEEVGLMRGSSVVDDADFVVGMIVRPDVAAQLPPFRPHGSAGGQSDRDEQVRLTAHHLWREWSRWLPTKDARV